MRRDNRLSGLLHVLLHMAEHSGPCTSDLLARFMDTNPVVIRRLMSGLRDRGYVQSAKGHGGGWTITCDLAEVTLGDIYKALGEPELLVIGNRSEAPTCLVEQAVNRALGKTFNEAEALLLSRFDEISLAELSAEFHARLVEQSASITLERSHDK